MTERVDLLIIGSGAAGTSAAFAARRADPGLSVLIIGKENRTEYSAPALPDYLSGELELDKVMVRTKEDYDREGIRLHLNDTVARIDPKKRVVKTESGKSFRYENLILATGSLPIQLRRMKGTDLPGNFVMKTVGDIDAMIAYGGKNAVVVGSGAIGLEGSMALKARGYKKVTMVEALDWLSPKSLDKAMSDELTANLNAFGIEVLAGEAVEGVIGETKVEGVVTSRRTIPCDIILWGIGMRPDVELAKTTGIELGELGAVRVDDRMRTNVPHIYACGDCIESVDKLSGKPAVHLFWEPAQRGGTVAGLNCAGLDKAWGGSVAVFLTHKGGLSIVGFGKTEAELDPLKGLVLEERKGKVYRRLHFEDGLLCGVQMINTLDDVDLLFDVITKNALERDRKCRLVKKPEHLDEMTITDVIYWLRKERRAVIL
ncbi:MAG: NAD(P)/FAD-dependent oxidoreductase [Lachnospiraceae bacterium]|nr:NAD(P)/FAD-dependent oxidoreductase [Lachnospiraceae bacterium]